MDLDDNTASTTPSSNDQLPDEQNNEDDNLFPESNVHIRPQTPQNDHLNATAPGELSPPRSQGHSHAPVNGHSTATAPKTSMMSSDFVASAGQKEDKPGAGWKSKKAQEEMQRAWDNVVDREFSLKEFGDVVLQGKQQRGEA